MHEEAMKYERETKFGFRPAGDCSIRLVLPVAPNTQEVKIIKEHNPPFKASSVLDDLNPDLPSMISSPVAESMVSTGQIPEAMKTKESRTSWGRLSSLPSGAREVNLQNPWIQKPKAEPNMEMPAGVPMMPLPMFKTESPKYDPEAVSAYLRDLMGYETRLNEILEENKMLTRMIARLQAENDQLKASK